MAEDHISVRAERGDNYGGFGIAGPMSIAREDLGGVQFIEVAVDTETGVMRAESVVAVHDCGRPMTPQQIESQMGRALRRARFCRHGRAARRPRSSRRH